MWNSHVSNGVHTDTFPNQIEYVFQSWVRANHHCRYFLVIYLITIIWLFMILTSWLPPSSKWCDGWMFLTPKYKIRDRFKIINSTDQKKESLSLSSYDLGKKIMLESFSALWPSLIWPILRTQQSSGQAPSKTQISIVRTTPVPKTWCFYKYLHNKTPMTSWLHRLTAFRVHTISNKTHLLP